jgi:hypothetical protein
VPDRPSASGAAAHDAHAAVPLSAGVLASPAADLVLAVLVMTARIRRLIDAIHATVDRDPETLAAVFRAHESALLGWP